MTICNETSLIGILFFCLQDYTFIKAKVKYVSNEHPSTRVTNARYLCRHWETTEPGIFAEPEPNRTEPNLRFFCRTEPNFCAYDLVQ